VKDKHEAREEKMQLNAEKYIQNSKANDLEESNEEKKR
jgi:hypothetical protein